MNKGAKPSRRGLLVYDGLPVRHGGAHRLSRLSPEHVLTAVTEFLDKCTGQADLKCALQFLSNQQLGVRRNAALFSKSRFRNAIGAGDLEGAKQAFGDPETRVLVAGPDDERVVQFSWPLSFAQLPEVVKWTGGRPTGEVPNIGPAWRTRVHGRFRIRDPRSGEILQYQGAECYGNQDWDGWHHLLGESYVNVAISVASTWGLIMSFPFESVSDEANALIGVIEGHLPFQFSRKTWSRWILNKAGTGYYQRKLELR